MKFSVIKGNENVINEINNYPESIGVISYNTISNPYTKEAARLRDITIIRLGGPLRKLQILKAKDE